MIKDNEPNTIKWIPCPHVLFLSYKFIVGTENLSSAERNNKSLALILKLIYIIGIKFKSKTLS